MHFRNIFIICSLLIASSTLSAQNIYGYWEGKIAISKSDSLTIGVNIDSNDSLYSVELDSPDQYFVGQPVSSYKWIDSTFSFNISSLNVDFSGNFIDNYTVLDGVFMQKGRKFDLKLQRGKERLRLNRPQTPKPPFGYRTEDLQFKDRQGRYTLISGTLTIPENPRALIVFITGSGWQDRDETMFAHKPFAVLADAFARAGYATFRYDDFPLVIFQKSTSHDFAEAVGLVIDSLKAINELKNLKIGLLGHSEGSLVAFMAAKDNPDVSFTIHLGGISMCIDDILSYQIEAISAADSTISQEVISESVKQSQALYNVVKKSKNIPSCIDALAKKWDQISAKLTEDEKKAYKMTPENKFTTIYSLSSVWYFELFHIVPKEYIKHVKTPVLAVSGEKDLQVPAEKSLKLMQKYLPKNEKNRFYVIPDCNHLLQPCKSGAPDEYPKIEQTVSEDVMSCIIKWMDSIVKP